MTCEDDSEIKPNSDNAVAPRSEIDCECRRKFFSSHEIPKGNLCWNSKNHKKDFLSNKRSPEKKWAPYLLSLKYGFTRCIISDNCYSCCNWLSFSSIIFLCDWKEKSLEIGSNTRNLSWSPPCWWRVSSLSLLEQALDTEHNLLRSCSFREIGWQSITLLRN